MSEREGDFGDSSSFARSLHRGKWANTMAGRSANRPAMGGRRRGVFLAHLFHVKLQPVTLKPHTAAVCLVQSIAPSFPSPGWDVVALL